HISIDNKQGIAQLSNNISTIYKERGELKQALAYGLKALNVYASMDELKGIGVSNTNIGTLYNLMGEHDKALTYGLKGMDIARQLGFPIDISDAAILLKDVYKQKKNSGKALEMIEIYISMRDSISNKETKRASIKNQLKYEYEKKAATDSIKVMEEKKILALKSKQEQTQRYFLYGGLTLTAIFSAFMFNRFMVIRKQKRLIEDQKNEVEKQKHLVDDKQKEILDSIRYAKRIQQSLLPTEKYIDRNITSMKNKGEY
nr:tetratricopeptide repeat protein [Bacteroidota bacterium]